MLSHIGRRNCFYFRPALCTLSESSLRFVPGLQSAFCTERRLNFPFSLHSMFLPGKISRTVHTNWVWSKGKACTFMVNWGRGSGQRVDSQNLYLLPIVLQPHLRWGKSVSKLHARNSKEDDLLSQDNTGERNIRMQTLWSHLGEKELERRNAFHTASMQSVQSASGYSENETN